MSDRDLKLWTTPKLVSFLKKASLAYRQGSPIIDDDTYDHLYLTELQKRDPLHPFLNNIEIEPDFGSDRLKHPDPMLSIKKSYSVDETKKWVTRIIFHKYFCVINLITLSFVEIKLKSIIFLILLIFIIES